MVKRRPSLPLFLVLLLCACRATGAYQPSDAVEIVLHGQRAFSAPELLTVMAEDLRAFEQEGLRKSALDDAAWRLEEFLRSEGYARAEVAYALASEGLPRPRATFQVSEGPRVRIARVSFPGAEAFEPRRLSAFLLRPARLLRDDTTWFVEGRVAAARGEIESLYIEQGYTEVHVAEPRVEYASDGHSVEVTLAIQEGPRRLLRGVELRGVAEDLLPAVKQALAEQIGQPWYARRAYSLRAAVREAYASNGHPQAQVELVLPDPLPADVVPEILVTPGPRVRIGALRIQGEDRSRPSFIRSRLRLAEGDLYDRRKERESFSRLLASGLFRRVEIELGPAAEGGGEDPSEEVRDLLVEVEELPARELFVEPGYGSYELLRLRVGAADRNVLGYGQTARTEATISQRSARGEVGYLWPALLGSDLSLDGRAFVGRREEPSFLREEWGTEWRLTRPFTRHVKATLGYEFRQSSARDIETAEDLEDDVLLSVISLSPSFDSRDGLFWPSGGTLVRLKTEWSDEAIGSQLDYVRLLGNLSRYHQLARDLVLAWSYRAGLIFPIGDSEEIPIQERFFNGGESTVRSFKEGRLGPKDVAGEPLGGEAFNVLSFELRYRFAPSWQAALFVDGGNVAGRVDDWGEFAGLRYGVGAGLRWLLPIGPVRLDLGVNPDPEPGEDDYRLHFSVGSAF